MRMRGWWDGDALNRRCDEKGADNQIVMGGKKKKLAMSTRPAITTLYRHDLLQLRRPL